MNAFRRWVTHDVLPAIRRQGEYETAAVIQRREALWAEIEADMERRGLYDNFPEPLIDEEEINELIERNQKSARRREKRILEKERYS